MKKNDLPKGWQRQQIGELCELINGRAFKPSDWGKEGLPIVRIQNLNDPTKPYNFYDRKVAEKNLIDSGDVLLSWSGTPGTSFGCFLWERGKAVLNQHIFKVQVNESLCDKEYFMFAVNDILDEMIAQAHGGVGLRHITKGKLERIELPIAPLDEQSRIVNRIKECLSRVDEIKRLREESREEAESIFSSVLASVFDDLKGECETQTIDAVTIESRYGTSQKCHSNADGIAILRIPNVAKGHINTDDLKYCHLNEAERERLLLQDGDILVVRTNGSPELVGRCAVVESNLGEEFGFASYLIRFRVDKEKVNPKFLSYFLTSTHGRAAIAKIRRTAAGQYNINSENIRAITFPSPDIDKQAALIEKMDAQQIACEQLVKEQIELSTNEGHLTQSILSKAFAGEL